ncbi:Ig-like domain from next BRCA1, partial [Rhizoctonia solani]
MGLFDFLKEDGEDSGLVDLGWSCRGCGVTNSPTQYKCLLCPRFSLCFKCHQSPAQHHTKHDPHNFAFVTKTTSCWECDGCGVSDENARAKCQLCEDVDFCLKCFNKGLSKVHSEHPKESDFEWYVYDDSGWVCDGCESINSDLGFNCGKCRDFILCPKCIVSAHKHHKLHPDPQTYTPVISLSRDWECDCCGKSLEKLTKRGLGGIRYQCNHCEDFTVCVKCIENIPKKHREHPRLENFTPVLYIGNQAPTSSSYRKKLGSVHMGREELKKTIDVLAEILFGDEEGGPESALESGVEGEHAGEVDLDDLDLGEDEDDPEDWLS